MWVSAPACQFYPKWSRKKICHSQTCTAGRPSCETKACFSGMKTFATNMGGPATCESSKTCPCSHFRTWQKPLTSCSIQGSPQTVGLQRLRLGCQQDLPCTTPHCDISMQHHIVDVRHIAHHSAGPPHVGDSPDAVDPPEHSWFPMCSGPMLGGTLEAEHQVVLDLTEVLHCTLCYQ